MPNSNWVVMKFGGTSVASVDGWRTIAKAACAVRAEGKRALVVCSALSGVSNLLERLLDTAARGEDITSGMAELELRHHSLAADMGVPVPDEVTRLLGAIRDALEGVRLLSEASPRTRARVLSGGELMSTHLGVAWLATQDVDCAWADARELLRAEPSHESSYRAYLSAVVKPEQSPRLRGSLPVHDVLVTQGFIASNHEGHTVLLGRGGSDTSASYLAVLLGADRVEIWTDVPGLFSAHPRKVENAQPLPALGYDEVAAMASLGVRALHPRCLEPVADVGLPLHVRSTYMPDEEGTVVDDRDTAPGIKAVTARKGLALLRMCRPSEWQPIGFVADVSNCFKDAGLSIDLMSTSPSTITTTVDMTSAPGASLDALLASLEEVCDVTVQRPVASVSLVGTGVRDTFEDVGDALRHLHGVPVEMVTQGAANHHLTVVVDEEQADGLVQTLHDALFAHPEAPSFRELPPLPVPERPSL